MRPPSLRRFFFSSFPSYFFFPETYLWNDDDDPRGGRCDLSCPLDAMNGQVQVVQIVHCNPLIDATVQYG